MTKKYTCSFYILLCVLFLMVHINCGRVPPRRNTYASEASRRQGDPSGPPGGGPEPRGPNDEPPEGPPGEPSGGGPPQGGPGQHGGPDRPKLPEDLEERTEDPDDFTDRTLQTVQMTDLPESAVDKALNLDYGRYSTLNFHYPAKQWMYSPPVDVCYDDYTKCFTSLVAPMPVCIMHNLYEIKTVFSYCDAYFYNCRFKHRYWRLVGYGNCVVQGWAGWPYLDDV